MFHEIPRPFLERMQQLEAMDAAQRPDHSLPKHQRLLAVSPETGRFLALLTAAAPGGLIVEVGTSSGYSTLWLALAARLTRRRIVTLERLEGKIALARETFRLAGVEDLVTLLEGDAVQLLADLREVSFCFLDADKDEYLAYYERVVPHLVPGGILVADNILSHAAVVEGFLKRALVDPRVDALEPLNLGKGLFLCRRTGGEGRAGGKA